PRNPTRQPNDQLVRSVSRESQRRAVSSSPPFLVPEYRSTGLYYQGKPRRKAGLNPCLILKTDHKSLPPIQGGHRHGQATGSVLPPDASPPLSVRRFHSSQSERHEFRVNDIARSLYH